MLSGAYNIQINVRGMNITLCYQGFYVQFVLKGVYCSSEVYISGLCKRKKKKKDVSTSCCQAIHAIGLSSEYRQDLISRFRSRCLRRKWNINNFTAQPISSAKSEKQSNEGN